MLDTNNKTLRKWMPVSIKKLNQHKLLLWIDYELLDLSLGFFEDSLHVLNKNINKKPFKLTSLNSWLEGKSYQECPIYPFGLIFQISRCGSTLLAYNLKNTDHFLVLSEPQIMNDIYLNEAFSNTPARAKIASCFIEAWSQLANDNGKTLVVKLSSKLLHKFELIIDDLNSNNNIFIYREPVAVVESLSRNPPEYLSNRLLVSKENIIEASCYIYKINIDKMINIKSSNNGLLVDYKNLKENFTNIVDFITKNKHNNLEWSEKWYAKVRKGEKKRYTSPPENEILSFKEDNFTLIKPLFDKYYLLNSLLEESTKV